MERRLKQAENQEAVNNDRQYDLHGTGTVKTENARQINQVAQSAGPDRDNCKNGEQNADQTFACD